MTEYMLMGDIHLSDRPPSSCTETYLDDIFAILEETVTLAETRGVRAVIWAGDIFHIKTPGRTTHSTVKRVIELAKQYPCPVYVVPGNHDLQHDRLSSINETQPLGVVLASGAVQLLNGWLAPYDLDDDAFFVSPVYGVPWLMRFEDATVSDALADYRELVAESQPSLLVTHAPLYPPGHELKYEFYPTSAWADAMENHGSVYYGHVHEPHGVYTSNGVTFCNAGAISRGSLHEHNLTREVSIALWDSDTGQFTIQPIPHKPAAEVFLLQKLGEIKTTQLKLDEFLASVGQATIEITSIESVMHHVRSQGLRPELTTLVQELLTGAA